MTSTKKAAMYARVSTSQQNVSNQLLELRQTADRFGWRVVAELIDDGISGAKGRSERPAFDRLFQMVQRREIDVVIAWDVSRLGRSIQDLVSFMNEVQAAGVDLYIHQQAINTATPAGRMVFSIFSALGVYERELIRERINAGLARARKEGKKLGRPSVASSPTVINSVRLLREKQMPIHQIAKSLKIGVGTVSRILAAA
jgi:DNA invertase Pin-like site-specific DNA recombinase